MTKPIHHEEHEEHEEKSERGTMSAEDKTRNSKLETILLFVLFVVVAWGAARETVPQAVASLPLMQMLGTVLATARGTVPAL